MAMSSSIRVTVPATTANLGPGFDCIGAALTLYNQFIWTRLDEAEALEIKVFGSEADRVVRDTSNLLYQSFLEFYQQLGQPVPGVKIEIHLGVPLARGLGSSATAIVGGLVAANALAGVPLSITEIMQLAIAAEGHPDNVVPALLGGCRLSVMDETTQTWQICDIPWDEQLVPVIAIPDFELSTAEARRVLPPDYSRADAIFNTAHLGLLVRGLETGNPDWLKVALQDKIHQPYRKRLIHGFDAVREAALQAGALEVVISGAGPTLLALTKVHQSEAIAQAMQTAWKDENVSSHVQSLHLDCQGTQVSNLN